MPKFAVFLKYTDFSLCVLRHTKNHTSFCFSDRKDKILPIVISDSEKALRSAQISVGINPEITELRQLGTSETLSTPIFEI